MCTAKMAHQSRFEKDLERDVRDLISYVTRFKRQESNFSLCQQFVISKLRYHEYLDVDHCKVERAIQGIQEKLLLHSQLAKADAWSRLTESFLTPITPSSVLIKDDTRHGLMWLLIRLAESPSNGPFITKATECQESDQEDTWDSSFLGESRESDDAVLSDTTEWSEESWEEEVELRVQHNIQNKPVNAHGDHPVGSVTSTLTTKAKPVPFTSESEQDERNVLKQHLMLQFWRGNFRRRVWSKHPNSNLLDRWENYCCSSKPFYEPAHRVVMTEAQLVREILWPVYILRCVLWLRVVRLYETCKHLLMKQLAGRRRMGLQRRQGHSHVVPCKLLLVVLEIFCRSSVE
uniref:Uncharacterized protein n=1 Tax=Eptatretus burgeri TaxID=7764 RepID=A0A8C4QYF6_EPTBU